MPENEGQDIPLAAPTILDRSRHSISRRNIDPDALKVLNRLHRHGFLAYLVGGAVRDLMLGRTPQDFDVGTNARPRQVKKLFRNAYLIGRRFRLAQVRFQGGKVIEVATFRRDPGPGEPEPPEDGREDGHPEDAEFREGGACPGEELGAEEAKAAGGKPEEEKAGAGETETEHEAEEEEEEEEAAEGRGRRKGRPPLPPIAFGTPREDAFRRDITINALFYDISTFSVIDYTGGLEDMQRRRIRVIGPPERRYVEDPVRMWRVLRHAGRLGFSVEEETERAIAEHRLLLASCSGSRLYEELNKDLKSGASRPILGGLRRHGLLSVLLGAPGAFYETSEEASRRLEALLGVSDASAAAGRPLSAAETYGLLFHAWADGLLAGFSGDRFMLLHDALAGAAMAITLPRALAADLVQTLVIADRMLAALESGRMRWTLRRRARYAEASRLCAIVAEGRDEGSPDPFEVLFRRRFGGAPETGEKKRRRRRRPRRKPPSPPAEPEAS
ncbi:MAG: hypothetical protein FJY83_00370 [Candidatus Aminicenantes bacterium]|nr:hypothetical protein [Candidatus Aminicenantes bacterium]